MASWYIPLEIIWDIPNGWRGWVEVRRAIIDDKAAAQLSFTRDSSLRKGEAKMSRSEDESKG